MQVLCMSLLTDTHKASTHARNTAVMHDKATAHAHATCACRTSLTHSLWCACRGEMHSTQSARPSCAHAGAKTQAAHHVQCAWKRAQCMQHSLTVLQTCPNSMLRSCMLDARWAKSRRMRMCWPAHMTTNCLARKHRVGEQHTSLCSKDSLPCCLAAQQCLQELRDARRAKSRRKCSHWPI